MPQNLATANDVIGYFEVCIAQIQRELNSYPSLKNRVNLSQLLAQARNDLIDQASSDPTTNVTAKTHYVVRVKEATAGTTSFAAIPSQWSDLKKDWMRFKADYLKWARNLIVNLNRAKLLCKLHWLDVKEIAAHLTAIELSEENLRVLLDIEDQNQILED